MANIVSITVNCQGAGKDYDEARSNALRRLSLANSRLQSDLTVNDPGVAVDDRDPGGGPCAPEKYSVEIFVNLDILPEAQSRDDD